MSNIVNKMEVTLTGEAEKLADGLIERLKAHSKSRYELGRYLAELKEKTKVINGRSEFKDKSTYTAILVKAGIHPNVAAEHVTIHNYLEATESRQAVFSYKHKQLLYLAREYKKDPDGDDDRRKKIDEFQAAERDLKAKSIEPIEVEEVEETIATLKAKLAELENDLESSREKFLKGLSTEALLAEARYLWNGRTGNFWVVTGVGPRFEVEKSIQSGNDGAVRKKLLGYIL